MAKSAEQTSTIRQIEQSISDMRFGRNEGPLTFNSAEVHELAEKGEFEKRSGSNETVGNRIPANLGLAYSPQKGLIIASSQEEADIIAKELTHKEEPDLAVV